MTPPQRAQGDLPTVFLGLVAFSLVGSLFTKITSLDPGPIAPVASILTLIAGVEATFRDYAREVPGAWVRVLAVFALGASAEIVGLATGFPFGRYVYSDAWWPTVALPSGPFPLSLPFAWLLMAGTSALSWGSRDSRTPTMPAGARALVGGLLAATVDLAMEPVLTGTLGYWRWLERGPLPGGAPLSNFLGWWATAALAGLLLALGAPVTRSRAPRWVLGGFVALILGLGAIGPI